MTRKYTVFSSCSGWSGKTTRYHVTQATTTDETEDYPNVAEFPVSSRYTAEEQRYNAWCYANTLNGKPNESTAK
jgi:hypothetical protein